MTTHPVLSSAEGRVSGLQSSAPGRKRSWTGRGRVCELTHRSATSTPGYPAENLWDLPEEPSLAGVKAGCCGIKEQESSL